MKGYYEKDIKEILLKQEKKKGEDYIFNNDNIGNIFMLLDNKNPRLIEKILSFCKKNILEDDLFKSSFGKDIKNRIENDDTFREVFPKIADEVFTYLLNISALNLKIYNPSGKALPILEYYCIGEQEFREIFIKHIDSEHRSKTVSLKGINGMMKLVMLGGFTLNDINLFIK